MQAYESHMNRLNYSNRLSLYVRLLSVVYFSMFLTSSLSVAVSPSFTPELPPHTPPLPPRPFRRRSFLLLHNDHYNGA